MSTEKTVRVDASSSGFPPEILALCAGRSDKDLMDVEQWVHRAAGAGIGHEAIANTLLGSGWPRELIEWLLAQKPRQPHRATAPSKEVFSDLIIRQPPLSIAILAGAYVLLAIFVPIWSCLNHYTDIHRIPGSDFYYSTLPGYTNYTGLAWTIVASIFFAFTARSLLLSGKFGIGVTNVIAWSVTLTVAIPFVILIAFFS